MSQANKAPGLTAEQLRRRSRDASAAAARHQMDAADSLERAAAKIHEARAFDQLAEQLARQTMRGALA